MIVNKDALLEAAPIRGMLSYKAKYLGLSHGLTECGYDIRIAQNTWLFPGRSFVLRSSVEYFHLPDFLMGRVLNKSTWARLGLDASMTTNIEPGWSGHLTLELSYYRWRPLFIPEGVGICQVIFEEIETPARYCGKYQNQPNRPVAAIRM